LVCLPPNDRGRGGSSASARSKGAKDITSEND
jgi:hypothetical protein